MTDDYEWRMFLCADCPEGEAYAYVQPIRAAAPWEAGGDMDFCPRCGGHLPFTPWGKVTVRNDFDRVQTPQAVAATPRT